MVRRLPALFMGALALFSSWAAAQSGLMPTDVESLDGNPRDLATSTIDLTTALEPDDERLLLAQGRRLAEFILPSRDRQFAGELQDFATELTAVEVDEGRDLMFVLTGDTNTGTGDIDGELRVYDIFDPSAPTQNGPALPVSGGDIRVIPEDQK